MFKIILITFGLLALFAAAEHAFGLYRRPGVLTMRELGASLLSLRVSILVRGASSSAVIWSLGALWPRSQGALAGVSFWLAFPLYVLADEYVSYWLHRKSHEWAWLWRLHKPHHAPRSMNVTVTFRQNWIWLLLAPYVWLSPTLLWLGLPAVHVAGLSVKTLMALMVHSDLRWDLHLQRNRFMRPVMWVIERIFSLPDTHHAHHGVGRHGNGMRNYGNTLVFFDLLHGTLMIPHARQEAFGLPEGTPVEPWAEQLFWPFVRSTKSARASA